MRKQIRYIVSKHAIVIVYYIQHENIILVNDWLFKPISKTD